MAYRQGQKANLKYWMPELQLPIQMALQITNCAHILSEESNKGKSAAISEKGHFWKIEKTLRHTSLNDWNRRNDFTQSLSIFSSCRMTETDEIISHGSLSIFNSCRFHFTIKTPRLHTSTAVTIPKRSLLMDEGRWRSKAKDINICQIKSI